jgi:uncharacterized protein
MSNLQAVKDIYDAMDRADVNALIEAMDPEIEWHEAEDSPYASGEGPWVGVDAIFANVFINFITKWEGFSIRRDRFHDAGDVVVMEGRYSGTCLETGKVLDAQVSHVLSIRNGRLVKFQQYTDTMHWAEVMKP